MKIYAITGWCGDEKYIEGYYLDKNMAFKECANMNKNRMLGIESLIVEIVDVDVNTAQNSDSIGYVYEVSKTPTGRHQAYLEAMMYEEDFQLLQKSGKAKSPIMNNPYIWVEKKSERLAIETFLKNQNKTCL